MPDKWSNRGSLGKRQSGDAPDLLRLAHYGDGARASARFSARIHAGLEQFCAFWWS
jgi:hypothetical protein